MGRGEHEDERHDLEGERGAHAGQQRACDAAGGGDGVGHAPEVVGHEYNSGGMRGEPAARDAHGDAHVRRRQRRPVVDPVPDHTHHAPPAELADRLELGGGLHACELGGSGEGEGTGALARCWGDRLQLDASFH
eukprot:scaffold5316_cov105-Isochrysis_galbana.AAC.9